MQLVQLGHRELIQRLVLLLCYANCLPGDVVCLPKRHTLAPEKQATDHTHNSQYGNPGSSDSTGAL